MEEEEEGEEEGGGEEEKKEEEEEEEEEEEKVASSVSTGNHPRPYHMEQHHPVTPQSTRRLFTPSPSPLDSPIGTSGASSTTAGRVFSSDFSSRFADSGKLKASKERRNVTLARTIANAQAEMAQNVREIEQLDREMSGLSL